MRWAALACVVGCGVGSEGAELRIEIADPHPVVELGSATTLELQAIETDAGAIDHDVSERATWTLSNLLLGTLDAGHLATDGRTGGVATILASADGLSGSATISVTIHSRRLVDGTPPDAPAWFAAAIDEGYDASLEPGDGAVLPYNLTDEVDFGALDSDDVHEVAVSAPYLDLSIYAAGAAGPRHVDLTAVESDAIGRTARGGSATIAVRSLHSTAPTTARSEVVTVAIADRPLGELMFNGVPSIVDPTMLGLWRYTPGTGAAPVYVMADRADGSCVGCHVAISYDGTRIATGVAPPPSGRFGMIVDLATRTQISTYDATTVWAAAAFDPGGRLVTSEGGTLTLRDGFTAAAIATVDLGGALAVQPSIGGGLIAYAVADGLPNSMTYGMEVRVSTWNPATGAVGPPNIVVPHDGTGMKDPALSPDGAWVAYAHELLDGTRLGPEIVRSGGGAPIALTSDAHDNLARWASPIAPTYAGGAVEPMAWIVMTSTRSIGVRARDDLPQLWLVPFYPDRGAAGRPFHLPGQPPVLTTRHLPELVVR